MISYEEALAIIGSAAKPLGTEPVALAEAAGRVLAVPVFAAIDAPRADVSAMDGYAVRDEDLNHYPVSLRVAGESFPGRFGIFYKVNKPTKNAKEAEINKSLQSKVAGLKDWQILQKNFERMK